MSDLRAIDEATTFCLPAEKSRLHTGTFLDDLHSPRAPMASELKTTRNSTQQRFLVKAQREEWALWSQYGQGGDPPWRRASIDAIVANYNVAAALLAHREQAIRQYHKTHGQQSVEREQAKLWLKRWEESKAANLAAVLEHEIQTYAWPVQLFGCSWPEPEGYRSRLEAEVNKRILAVTLVRTVPIETNEERQLRREQFYGPRLAAKGMSWNRLGVEAQVGAATISGIRRGRTKTISPDVRKKIAETLGCKPEDLPS